MKRQAVAVGFVLLLAAADLAQAGAQSRPAGDLPDPDPDPVAGGGTSSGGGGSSGGWYNGWWVWSEGGYNCDCDRPDVDRPRLWFSASPWDVEVKCPDEVPAAPAVWAEDGCDGCLGTILPAEVATSNAAGALVRVRRTWTATDAAGNSSEWIQAIGVRDVEWPRIDVPRTYRVKVDEKTRKGAMPDFRPFARDDRCRPEFAQSVRPGSLFPAGHEEPVVLTAADECGRQTTNSTTVVFGCGDCPGACAPGEGTPNLGSVDLELGVGRLADGRSAGSLRLHAGRIEPRLGRPESMVYVPENGGAETIRTPDGDLRQIRTAQALVEFAPVNSNSYQVRFFSPADCLSKSRLLPSTNWYWEWSEPAMGIEGHWHAKGTTCNSGGCIHGNDPRFATNRAYATTGTPFAVWVVAQPWSDPGRLVLTQIRPGNVCRHEYTCDPAGQTWCLESGDGLRTEADSSVWDEAAGVRTVDAAALGPAGTARQEIREYRRFPWGEARVSTVRDSSGAALEESCGYCEDPREPGKYMRKAWERHADGSFVGYDYDDRGRIAAEARTWKDVDPSASPPAEAGDRARATLYGYEPVDPADDGSLEPLRPRSVVERIAGATVSKTLFSFSRDKGGRIAEIREECLAADAAFGDARNLRTTTVRHSDAEELWPAQPKSVQYPDGRLDRYAYERGHYVGNGPAPGVFTPGPGGFVRTTLDHGTVEHPEGTGKTTREIAVRDVLRGDVLRETHVFDGTQYVRVDWTTQTYDDFGHPLVARSADGTFRRNVWDGCCGKGAEIAADGTATYFEYDVLGRLRQRTVDGAAPADYPRQPNRTTRYELDAEGRVLRETTSAADLALVSSNRYDLAGRLVETVDPAGLQTRYEYAEGGRVSTAIRPGGATETAENYLDGRPKSVTGTGVVPRFYDYGVNPDGSQWTLVHTGRPDSPMWEKTTVDMLGRTVKVERPGFGGTVVTTASEYNGKGQLAATRTWAGDSTRAPLLPATLYEYDELGDLFRTAVDVDGNGRIDLRGPDRIHETQTRIVKKYGERWRETLSKVYPEDGNAEPVVVATRRQAMLGADGGAAAKTQAADVRGNLTSTAVEIRPASKTVRTVRDVPESTADAVSVVVNGLLRSETTSGGLTAVYDYDGLGRQISAADPRKGAAQTHYDGRGRVDYVEDAAGTRTSFLHDPDTGLQTCVIDALNENHTAYDLQGRPTNVWGATYPVAYEYDAHGRMSAMKTWRDVNAKPDVTRWLYDEATGLLTNKVYADGTGPAYEYDAAGRLTKRIWARGVETRYAYDALGQLANVDYSDSTPDVSYAYDRMGRPATITDALGTRTHVYDPATLDLAAEQLPDGQTLARAHDRFGRPAGIALSNGYRVAYAYDDAGRFAALGFSVPSVTTRVQYAYLPQSDLVSGWTIRDPSKDPTLLVKRSYESRRDLVSSIEVTNSVGLLMRYDYSNDRLGRRIARKETISGGNVWSSNSFGYNDRSELDVAVMGTNQFGYQYDAIGNRLAAVADGRTVRYRANRLNQYASILPSAGTPAYDADGNMTSDGSFTYAWDAENRLAEVRSNGAVVVRNAYDYIGRRVRKTCPAGGEVVAAAFTYDGWNLILEDSGTNRFSYLWGLDLSGSLHGAGGVGGLVAQTRHVVSGASTNLKSAFWFTADANGNVAGFINSANQINRYVASYDPFGNLIMPTSSNAKDFKFRFSSKYCDDETGLYYYGYRFYSPGLGRWLSRDPSGERGGDNLYMYVDNDALNLIDPDGRGIWPLNRRRNQPEYEAVVQGADPTFPQQGIWMCQEELVGKSVVGLLHHRFVVFNGNARGFEKRTRWPFGGQGRVRDEGAPGMKVRNDMSCYEMRCLKKDCARKIFDRAVSSGQGKRYWLGFRDCQSWANNVERSMYKQCEDCPCSEEDKARRNTWKHAGWRELTLNDNPAPDPDPGPWPPPEDPSPGIPVFRF